MPASDSASDRFNSKRILYFANLICFPVSEAVGQNEKLKY